MKSMVEDIKIEELAIVDRSSSWKIPSLDGIRGVAILMVLVNHGGHMIPTWLPGWTIAWADGPLGVRIFFVLSGYLMCSLGAAEIARTGQFDWKGFYLRRALRILPCIFVYLLVIATLAFNGLVEMPATNYLRALTFSQNFVPWLSANVTAMELNVGHFWSLAFEEQFYLFWPLLMLLCLRRRLARFIVVVILLGPVMRIISYLLLPSELNWAVDRTFPNSFDCIAMGVLLSELSRDTNYWRPRLDALIRLRWPVYVALVFPLLIHRPLVMWLGGGYSLLIGKTMEITSIAIVIFAAVTWRESWLYKLLNTRPLQVVGVISYGLYVWNNLLLGEGNSWINQFPTNILALVAVVSASYWLVEVPALRLKHFFR